VKYNEQIKLAVIDGQRPDVNVISGPDSSTTLTVEWISRCWNQEPLQRPEFSGNSPVMRD